MSRTKTAKRRRTTIASILLAGAAATVATAAALDTQPEPLPERPVPVIETYSPSEGLGRYTDMETEPTETDAPETDAPETEPAELEPLNLGTFTLTAYCPCPKCCGEWSDGITYMGTWATQGRTIAVDPDVIPLGSSVEIAGQTYVAEDIGGAIQGNRIDVFFRSHAEALQFGVQYADVLLGIETN